MYEYDDRLNNSGWNLETRDVDERCRTVGKRALEVQNVRMEVIRFTRIGLVDSTSSPVHPQPPRTLLPFNSLSFTASCSSKRME